MKRKSGLIVTTALSAALIVGGALASEAATAISSEAVMVVAGADRNASAETSAPSTSTSELGTGTVTVYDYGDVKLHAILTGDALGDAAYIVEGEDSLTGIELPAFTEDLDAWKSYADSLGKSMNNIFLCDHPTGASYVEGMNILGTQGAADAIASGSTYATTQGLYETFGSVFHGGDEMARINTVVSGSVDVAGIGFNVIDCGDTYDLEIPELNVIYTHMLGKTSHSIIASTEHMDIMEAAVKGYQDAGYDMVLTSHGGPEGQDAVAEKLSYIAKTREIAAASSSAEEFTAAMLEAFPDYTGENYLEMTAGFLFS